MKGFEDFLGAKTSKQLLTISQLCPIVVLNAHDIGCDALILVPDGITHVALQFDSAKSQALVDTLQRLQAGRPLARHPENDNRHLRLIQSLKIDPNERMKRFLAEIWGPIVKPVLDQLDFRLAFYYISVSPV